MFHQRTFSKRFKVGDARITRDLNKFGKSNVANVGSIDDGGY